MSREPGRIAAGHRQRTAQQLRRLVLLGAVLTVALPAAAAAAGHVANHETTRSRRPADTGAAEATAHSTVSASLSSVIWPQQGEAALVIGNGKPAASPDQRPVPIASVAKVMTAYLTLEHDPLSGEQDGFTVTITPSEVQTEAQDEAEGGSVVAVQAGEQLTERQLLEALLIPSGNNIAQLLAVRVGGSEASFLTEMNAEARALGMDRTTYTDPSGFDPSTVSTAADQLRVFQQAMRFSVFRQIVSTASVPFPVVGSLTNTNPLIVDGYSGKTGSDSAAGACLAFFTGVTADGRLLTATGVVLGQWQDNEVILDAAGEAAVHLVDSVIPTANRPTAASPATVGLPRRHRSTPVVRRRP